MSNSETQDDRRCLLCQQPYCDVTMANCGCLLHSTCVPLYILFPGPRTNSIISCPSCRTADVTSISILPLPVTKLEEALHSREQDNGCSSTNASDSLLASDKKRAAATRSTLSRTGRWTHEESAFVDRIIKTFDSGLLPLPHGIKLNEFLCDLLACKTSRLTKKLKHEKLSARSYRSVGGCIISGNGLMSVQAGIGIQRAQTLFLRTISPPSLQMELRLNVMRVWRTQLANLCLQVGSHNLVDTTEWITSLSVVEHISSEDSLEAKRKRLKHALVEDANAAAQSGYDASDMISPNQCPSSTSAGAHESTSIGFQVNTAHPRDMPWARDSFYSLDGSIARESETHLGSQRKFTFGEDDMQLGSSLHEVSSFASLAALLTTPTASRRQSKAGSDVCDDVITTEPTGVLYEEKLISSQKPHSKPTLEGVIDSVVEGAFTEEENHGKFLAKVSRFLQDSNINFQHVDLWVPTEHCGSPRIRLTNAGFITVGSKSPSHVTKRLNEFGVYSKSFAFTPGFGLPGKVFVSNQPTWMNKLHDANPEEFSRVGGAKVYGVSTAVGLPVTSSIGTIVAVLYSTSDLTRDADLEARCMSYFHQLRPTPKWRLYIDVASDATEDPTAHQLPSLPYSSSTSIVPPSPVAEVSQASSSLNAQSLALLLGKYESSGLQGDSLIGNSMSLRLMLLRHPSCRTTIETDHVNTILSKYRSYVGAKYSESDIIRLIVKDWSTIALANMSSANTAAYSRVTSSDSYQVKAPNPESFGSMQPFHAAFSNDKKIGLEPRVVSDPTFQVQDYSPSLSPANFDSV
ncbi:hypothetical protein ACHAWO_000548 [Cyclotella atomus]|uniref:RING-type domain-containing protein n=1 Tax=Cyclotella atomus TaxID=382360 RepID=A0ABD3NPV9_9STRA